MRGSVNYRLLLGCIIIGAPILQVLLPPYTQILNNFVHCHPVIERGWKVIYCTAVEDFRKREKHILSSSGSIHLLGMCFTGSSLRIRTSEWSSSTFYLTALHMYTVQYVQIRSKFLSSLLSDGGLRKSKYFPWPYTQAFMDWCRHIRLFITFFCLKISPSYRRGDRTFECTYTA